MKSYRVFSIILLFVLVVNSFGPVTSVKAQIQPLFEGMIAYVDSTGNIVIATGDGQQRRIISDANLDTTSEKKTTYQDLNFSPNGAYLSFVRSGYEGESETFIYDVSKGSINKFELDNTFIQWHKDSDSFIVEYHHDVYNDSHTDYLTWREYFRQYLSGEKVLLFKLQKNNNGFVINFENNTVFYTPDNSPDGSGIIYNWADNIEYKVERYGTGYWSPDGTSFVVTDNSNYYFILDLKTGTLVKKTELLLPIEHTFPNGETYNLSAVSNDISPDSTRLLLSDDLHLYDFNLYTLNSETIYTSQHDSPDYHLYGNWSRSGNIMMFDEYSINSSYYDDLSDDQSLFTLEKGSLPVFVANNAESLFWLSENSERLLYKQYTKNGQKASVELMLFDYANRASVKIGDLPTIIDVEFTYDTPTDFIVAWTDGEVDLPVNPGTVPPVTMAPDASALQGTTPSETTACPFEIIFQEKEGVINSLLNPAQASELETGIDIPLPSLLLDPSKWRYDENGAKDKVASLRKECEGYANGTMTPDQKSEFERKIMAFKRLTYTEIVLNGMYPQFVNTAHETSKSTSEVLIGAFSSLYMLGEIGGWLGNKAPTLATLVDKFFIEAKSFLLELVDGFFNRIIAKMGDIGRMTQFTFRPVLQMAQVLVDPKSKLDDIGIESVFEKLLTGLFLSKYVNLTQSEINIAVANVPPGVNTNYQYLEIYGTDLEGEQAIDTLLKKSTQDTEQAIVTMQTWSNSAENVDIVSGVSQLTSTGLLVISPVAGPAAPVTLSLATFLKDLAAVMKVIVLAMQGKSAEVGISNLNQITLYATNSADIAFDPTKISLIAAQENQIINLDVASLYFVPANYIPARTYYSSYQEQAYVSVDSYKASIERLMQAIAGGQDGQIRLAAEELLRVDEELRATLKIAEAPLNDMPFDRSEVQNLDFSVQDLRAQSVTLHVALMAYMVERASLEIQQETQTIVSDVLVRADNFKMSYETLSQSGLAIPSKFLPVILDVKTPETIVQGDTFSLTVKIFNVGQMSQQSPVTLSVAGGDKVSFSANQPLPEIASGSQLEIPVNLIASKSGDEFVVAEIVQDGSVIASNIVWLEIGKSDNIFSMIPTQYLLAGGLGLLCLSAFAIGGVFIFTRSRKPKHTPSKAITSQLPQTPISSSAEQIKRAIQLTKSKNLQEAFDILREVVKSEPNNASAWFNLGSALVHMENYRDAERCYSRARQLGHPRADEALKWLKQKYQ